LLFFWPSLFSSNESISGELVLGELVLGELVLGELVLGELVLGELPFVELGLLSKVTSSDGSIDSSVNVLMPEQCRWRAQLIGRAEKTVERLGNGLLSGFAPVPRGMLANFAKGVDGAGIAT
jgi:hypothetical protein